MTVKICGREIRCNKKIIKVYTLARHACVLLVFVMLCGPVVAAERDGVLDAERCAMIAPAVGVEGPERTPLSFEIPEVRQAAQPAAMSPALALALALGVRNVAGPMEQSAYHYSPRNPPASSKHAGSPRSHRQDASFLPKDRPPRLAMQK